jgi:hypothetical protein
MLPQAVARWGSRGALLDEYSTLYKSRGVQVEEAVEQIVPIHKAQLLSYLKLSNKNSGLFINFNTLHLKEGIVRLAYNLPCVPLRSPAVKK